MSEYKCGFAEINETTIYFEMKGEGHPLVMVHGQPLDSRMWDEQFEEFSKSFLTIRFDMPGNGKSGVHNNEFSLLKDMKSLLEFLEIDRTFLIGLSVGGMLCLDFTLAYPEMVDKLVLVSTGLLGWAEVSSERQKFNEKLNAYYQSGDKEQSIQLMTNTWLAGPFRSADKVNQDIKVKFYEMVRTSFNKERGKGKMILPETRTIDVVENISVPTLIVSSELDFPEFIEIAKFLNGKIKNSQLISIQGTAHMINMEKPIEFNYQVACFLAN
jgi:3-oxoadipate enol-lactonase